MILKNASVESTRYYFGVKGLNVYTKQFENKSEFEDYINKEFDYTESNYIMLNDFRMIDVDEDISMITLKELVFECTEGMICLYALGTYYLMNDNGKTVETI